MPSLPDDARTRLLLLSFDRWFGPPLIRLDGKVLDGRKRLAAWEACALAGEPPSVDARDRRDAGRLLLLVGHTQRAHDVLGDSIFYDLNTAALLQVPPELGAELVALHRRTPSKRRQKRQRIDVVARVQKLYFRCTEDGYDLSPADLRAILEDWS